VQLTENRLDNAVIPRSGMSFEFNWHWNDANPGANEQFPTARTELRLFKRIDKPASVFLTASGGTTFGYQQTGLPVFGLGGSQQLAAYGTNELLTNQYYYFQGGYLRELFSLPPLLGDKVYFIGAYEIAKPFNLPASDDLILSSHLPMDAVGGVVVTTIFGPIEVGGSVGDTDHHRFFFKIGRIF
jgi:NTE family protein